MSCFLQNLDAAYYASELNKNIFVNTSCLFALSTPGQPAPSRCIFYRQVVQVFLACHAPLTPLRVMLVGCFQFPPTTPPQPTRSPAAVL